VVILAAPSTSAHEQALQLVRKKGVLCLFASPISAFLERNVVFMVVCESVQSLYLKCAMFLQAS